MEITNLFNFDGTTNQVSRDVVYFIQRLNETLDYKLVDVHNNEVLDAGRISDYLDATYDEYGYDDWEVNRVYFDGNVVTLYISDAR